MTLRDNELDQRVDELMLEAGHPAVPELRSALMSIGSLAFMPVPAPGPALAALMAGQPDAGLPDDLTRLRWLHRHRPSVVGIAVLTGMGLGVTGVAANDPEHYLFDSRVSIQQMAQDWTPGWSVPVTASAQAQGVSGEILPVALAGPAAIPRTPAQSHPPALVAPSPSPDISARQHKADDGAQQGAEQRNREQRSRAGKDVVGPVGSVANGKSTKLDAGAAATEAAIAEAAAIEAAAAAAKVDAGAAATNAIEATEAFAARTPDTDAQQLARTENSAESANVAPPAPELRPGASRWSGEKLDKESAARQASDSASGWHKKFRR